MRASMEDGVGIYRDEKGMQATCDKLAELRERYRHVKLDDYSRAFNTDWLTTLELGYSLEVAQAMAHSAWNAGNRVVPTSGWTDTPNGMTASS